ncbi:MAG: DUF2194 domain-containing protein [Clostridia bacterium]
MKSKSKTSFGYLLVPLAAMLILALVLLVHGRGMQIKQDHSVMAQQLLEADAYSAALSHEAGSMDAAGSNEIYDEGYQYLVLYSHHQTELNYRYMQTLCDVLSSMRINYHAVNILDEPLPDLSPYRVILYASNEMLALGENAHEIIRWTEKGGYLGIMVSPAVDDVFRTIYRKLGVVEYGTVTEEFHSILYKESLFPLYQNVIYTPEDMKENAPMFRLSSDCVVHVESGDEKHLPLLWEHALQKGHVVVLNSDMGGEKDSRGMVSAAVSLVDEAVAYPIINSSMIFIDDFPAPQPVGYDKRLLQQYGYDIQGFYRNHWWPDMERLWRAAGCEYSGVLVETYNDVVSPPFQSEGAKSLLRYYGTALMKIGGEIGLHGYNHMPLCPEGFPYAGEDYEYWLTKENMKLATAELWRFAQEVFPEAKYQTYVPPSNYLSDEGREVVLEELPNVRVISGLYLPETGVEAYVQEFGMEKDGIVAVPRITSGFQMDEYNHFVFAQEMYLHGVFSHFIHPDDVLDVERGALEGWDAMFGAFFQSMLELKKAYPPIRMMNASEGAAAVQRFDQLRVKRVAAEDALRLELDGFVDEAWLALRTRRVPKGIEGGTLFPLLDGFYWIRAEAAQVTVHWEVAP